MTQAKYGFFGALSFSLSTLATPAFAIELTDYVDPTSDYDAAFINGNIDTSSGGSLDQRKYDIDLSGSYSRQYSTLPRTWSLSTQLSTALSRGGDAEDTETEDTLFQLNTAVDNYFSRERPELFWFLL